MMILNSSNISFPDFRENEVTMALNVMEENVYAMSPQLALELALSLETKAREVIARQAALLQKYEAKKAAIR